MLNINRLYFTLKKNTLYNVIKIYIQILFKEGTNEKYRLII